MVARWYNMPKVERSLSDLIKIVQLMGSYGLTFAAIGEVFALTNHTVEKFREKDFWNGAMGGFVASTYILGLRGMILLMCVFMILIIDGICSNYRRRCQIRAPCCNEVFDCRHCHNDAKNSMDVHALDRHDVPRHEVRKVICSHYRTEQDVQQSCITFGICMGKYFYEKCNFFDDEDSKQQYHCDGCGICRTGGNDNFFHCYKCGLPPLCGKRNSPQLPYVF